MSFSINNRNGLINLKKGDFKQYLNNKENNKSYFEPYLSYDHNCNCKCHNRQINLNLNNNNNNKISILNYNSDINSNHNNISESNIYKKINKKGHRLIRNKSMNYMLSLEDNKLFNDTSKIYTTNYTYNFNYFDNVENGILKNRPKSNSNKKIYTNEKIDILKNDNKDNLSKSFIISQNKVNTKNNMNSKEIFKNKLYKYYYNANTEKYSYGGPNIKISNNINNHSYKEIYGRSASCDKILNKSLVINFARNNTFSNEANKENFDKNISNHNPNSNIITQVTPPPFYNNIQVDMSNNKKNNNYYYNYNYNINNNKTLKKSISENILSTNINGYQNNFINNANYIDKKIKNENNYQNNFQNNLYNKCNDCGILNNNINIEKNDYLLKYKTNNNINSIYIPTYNLNNENINCLNNNNNSKYYYTFKKNYYPNKKTIPKSYSVNNFNFMNCNYLNSSININPKNNNNLIKDFNYEQFKLKVKLNLLRKQVYKNEKFVRNKNRLNTNYLSDKNYVEKILNNNRKSGIKDIVLEKTKKLMEEKKYLKDRKINDNQNIYNYKYKNDSQLLFNLKKNLLENNKRNNNKYVLKPKFNIYNS